MVAAENAFRGTENDDWLLYVMQGQENCRFASLDLTVAMDDVFEEVS